MCVTLSVGVSGLVCGRVACGGPIVNFELWAYGLVQCVVMWPVGRLCSAVGYVRLACCPTNQVD